MEYRRGPRAHELWSDDDIRILTQLAQEGVGAHIVAGVLGRSTGAIYQKAATLALRVARSARKDARSEAVLTEKRRQARLATAIAEARLHNRFGFPEAEERPSRPNARKAAS